MFTLRKQTEWDAAGAVGGASWRPLRLQGTPLRVLAEQPLKLLSEFKSFENATGLLPLQLVF